MIGFTHAVFAWAVSIAFSLNPFFVLIGGLFPDLEFILDTVHRGPLHSLVLILPLCFVMIFLYKEGISFSVGVFSHLFLDSLTFQGLPLFYPLFQDYFSFYFFNTEKLNWIFIVFSFIFIFNRDKLLKKDLNVRIVFPLFGLWVLFLVMFKFLA